MSFQSTTVLFVTENAELYSGHAAALLRAGSNVVVVAPAALGAALAGLAQVRLRAIVLDAALAASPARDALAAPRGAHVPVIVVGDDAAEGAAPWWRSVARADLLHALGVVDAPEVLLVEDDGDLAAIVACVLAADGWRVTTVATRAAALGRLDAAPAPAVVVLDLGLADGDGAAVLAARGRTPAVVVSGAHDAAAVAAAAGVTFVPKPSPLDDLRAAVALHRVAMAS